MKGSFNPFGLLSWVTLGALSAQVWLNSPFLVFLSGAGAEGVSGWGGNWRCVFWRTALPTPFQTGSSLCDTNHDGSKNVFLSWQQTLHFTWKHQQLLGNRFNLVPNFLWIWIKNVEDCSQQERDLLLLSSWFSVWTSDLTVPGSKRCLVQFWQWHWGQLRKEFLPVGFESTKVQLLGARRGSEGSKYREKAKIQIHLKIEKNRFKCSFF